VRRPEYSQEALEQLIAEKRWGEVARALRSMDPADTADFLEELDTDDRDTAFRLLDPDTASDVLVELETPYLDDVVEDVAPEQLADLADKMAPDEAARFLTELDDDQSAKVLAEMKESEEVSELLSHAEDTAGHIMTTEYCALPAGVTVKEAREALAPMEVSDPVLYVYVVEQTGDRLQGVVSLKQLFTASPMQRLGDIAEADCVFCYTDEDQQEVARKFRKYDLWVMPVVDHDHRIVGRITVDDIIDVVHEEADEDLAMLVGAPDIDTEEDSPLAIARLRLPWLMITMCAGLVNSLILRRILDVTPSATLAIFVPAVMAMGGNTGIQSSAVAVRGIALGYKAYGRLLSIVGREISVGIFLGVSCGTLTASAIFSILSLWGVDTGLPVAELALAVGLAMCNAMIFASCFGSVVPVLLHRLGVDPAVASGPFVTTSNDLSASMIYFVTCLLLLR
jgi:magnesium transporter